MAYPEAVCLREQMKEAIGKGGLWSYAGLDGQPGGFVPHVCRATLGKPCPECQSTGAKKVCDLSGSIFFVRCPVCRGLKMLFEVHYE